MQNACSYCSVAGRHLQSWAPRGFFPKPFQRSASSMPLPWLPGESEIFCLRDRLPSSISQGAPTASLQAPSCCFSAFHLDSIPDHPSLHLCTAMDRPVTWQVDFGGLLVPGMQITRHSSDLRGGCCCSFAKSYPTLCDPVDFIACLAPLSMEFSRQEYWSGLPFPLGSGPYLSPLLQIVPSRLRRLKPLV